MSLLLLFGGAGDAIITAPMATATADAVAPSLKLDQNLTAPMAVATADAIAPALLVAGGALVSSPLITATADALTPTVKIDVNLTTPMATATGDALTPTMKVDRIIVAPMATATADAQVARFDVTIAAPMAQAIAQASPPMGVERARTVLLGTSSPTPARRSRLGTVVHVFTSPDGDSDVVTALGDWWAEDDALGGFMGAGGTLPRSIVESKPNIYRWGTMWRSYHVQTRTCLWGGRIKQPRKEEGAYTLDGLGWGQIFGEKKIEYLLYQALGTEGWQVGMSEPWVKESIDGLTPNQTNGDPNWETTIQDDMIQFKRTTKFEGATGADSSLYAVFYAPNLPAGESLTRIAFTLNVLGDTLGFSAAGSAAYSGIDHPNRVLRTNVQDDMWTAAATGGLTRAMGPVGPHVRVFVAYLNEESGEFQHFSEVAHIHANGNGNDSKWDMGLLDVWTSAFAHDTYATPGSSAGGWAARPSSQVASALVADPGGQYTPLAGGGLHAWNGEITALNSTGILSRVNLILIQAANGHSFNDAGVFKWSDDLSTGVTIKLRDIRVNGLAEGDNMTAGQLVKDIAARRGLPEDYIDGGGWNILPYKIEQGKVSEAWEYASMISNRRARTGDSGCRPTFEFQRYGPVWCVDDERQEMTPIALDQFDRVRVRYEMHAATTSVKVKADPSPLPYQNEYETIDLPTALRSQDRAEQFGEDVLEYLVQPRTGGTGRLTDVVDEHGARRSAHLIRAGDIIRHAPSRSPNMRATTVRHTYDDVEVTFPDEIPAVERLTARREQRIADGRRWHRN